MSYTNQTNLQFSFTFYYAVHYLGLCENITDPNKYGKPMTLPEKWQQIPIICLSSIAFLFNALSLFIFLFGEFTINRKMSTSQLHETKTMKSTTSSTTKTLSKCKSRKHGHSRSSFLTSLIILSTFEVIFNLSVVIYKLIEVFSPYFIHQVPLDSVKHIPPDMKLIIIPVLQNIIMFFGDVGLMCRNWCICLITAARAEVVIWPLGSKSWQRILRNPRRFMIISFVFLFISIILSALKHVDYIGLLCYDESNHIYGLWSEEYLWTYEGFSKYMTFIVLPYQALVTWIIITVFTVLILLKLKPWRNEENSVLFHANTKSLDDIPNIVTTQQQQCSIQQDAIHKRHQGQLRATRIVLVVAILFGLLECMNFIISICQTSKLLTNKRLSRILETIGNTLITLDSICNFLVFISMMSYFRHLFIKIFLCKEVSSNVNHSSSVSQKATSCTSINQTCSIVVENTRMK
ncbi:hypothetical protein MN116_000802 [Schistosoma mekongi]|uniref:Rhodopsin-like orphan GPCR n=1 Tax=Schistosoma mekongi TaxID=38744 RepID=A0AAE1ZKI1_SCHME|nr:hypothetical protein MN116_000802 [Schistosoma mekongi]